MPKRTFILRPAKPGMFNSPQASVERIEITVEFEGTTDEALAEIESFFRDQIDQPFLRGAALQLVSDQLSNLNPADVEATVVPIVETIIAELYGPDERFAARSRARIANALMSAAAQGYRLSQDGGAKEPPF